MSTRLDDLRGASLPAEAHPPRPICRIDDETLQLEENSGSLRSLIIIPWLVGLTLALALTLRDEYSDWKNEELNLQSFVDARRKVRGADYFERTDNEVALEMYRRLDADGRLPLDTYAHYRFFKVKGGQSDLYFFSALALFYIISIPGLLVWAIRFPRRAPLLFDRRQGIAYSWRSGRVFAQRFSSLSYASNWQALYIFLRRRNAKTGALEWARFPVQPSGNPYFSTQASQTNVLIAAVKFMESGRDAVWPRDWRRQRGWFLREDRRPSDFSVQLAALLEMIDAEAQTDR